MQSAPRLIPPQQRDDHSLSDGSPSLNTHGSELI
jgi:hypothetical protein